jgi:ankyrin repeat protein
MKKPDKRRASMSHNKYSCLLFLYLFLSESPLNAMNLQQSLNHFEKIPQELFIKICVFKQGKKPWQEFDDTLQLRRVCQLWNQFLSNHALIAQALKIPPMHFAAMRGNADEIIRLKLYEKGSVCEPDEQMFCPCDYAVALDQKTSIKILKIGNALKPGQDSVNNSEPANSIHEYTIQDIQNALINDQSKTLETILLHDIHKGIELLLQVDFGSPLLSRECKNLISYAIECTIEKELFFGIASQTEASKNFFKNFKKFGANPNIYNFEGLTPLHRACSFPEKLSIVQGLLKLDAIDVNCVSKDKQFKDVTPLHAALISDNQETIKALLATNKCDLNLANYYGTALHVAVQKNNVAIIKLLMHYNANLYTKKRNYDNATPIHDAAQNETTDALSYFCSLPGCQIDIKDDIGRTPLWYAVCADSLACVNYLLDKKANITVRINDGKTILHAVVTDNSERCLPTLLSKIKYAVNSTAKNGQSPLHCAARCGHTHFVEPLITAGALINYQDYAGDTALHYAASRGHIETIKELIKYRADMQCACFKDGYFKDDTKEPAGMYTPLHYAARQGHLDAVKLLMECNADPMAKTQLGKTAFDIAKERNHTQIMARLLPAVIKNSIVKFFEKI